MIDAWTADFGGGPVPLQGEPVARDAKNVTLVLGGDLVFRMGAFVTDSVGYYLPAFAGRPLPRVRRPDGSEWTWPVARADGGAR